MGSDGYMKILTIATTSEGYFDLLTLTARRWGFDLYVLGWQEEWKGFAWKIELYIDILSRLEKDEPVVCVDGYDVVVVGPVDDMREAFRESGQRIVFSGQRYFPNHRWIQKLADQVMSNHVSEFVSKGATQSQDYRRPCMGLVVACAGDLLRLFQQLIEMEKKKKVQDDQTLLNMFYIRHPLAIHLDMQCKMFQNLWRTRPGLYGQISAEDPTSEVEVFFDQKNAAKRIRNKRFNTTACFLHGPFNLDMGPLLRELGLDVPPGRGIKNWHYWRYSIVHHIKRALKLYFSFLRASS